VNSRVKNVAGVQGEFFKELWALMKNWRIEKDDTHRGGFRRKNGQGWGTTSKNLDEWARRKWTSFWKVLGEKSRGKKPGLVKKKTGWVCTRYPGEF